MIVQARIPFQKYAKAPRRASESADISTRQLARLNSSEMMVQFLQWPGKVFQFTLAPRFE